MNHFRTIGACVAVAVSTAALVAEPAVSILPSAEYAIIDKRLVSGEWQIEITARDTGAPLAASDVTITIQANNNEPIGLVIIGNNTGTSFGYPARQAKLTINKPTTGTSPANIGFVAMHPSTPNRDIVLKLLDVRGTLGKAGTTPAVSCPNIEQVRVLGNVVNDIVASQGAGSTSSISTIDVTNGYIGGSIYAPYGSIGPVSSAQTIAARSTTFPFEPNGAVNIYARDTIQSVTSTTGMIWANIDANAYNTTGRLGSVAGSSFKGSIRATGFYGANGGDFNRISIDNDLQGDITLTGAALGYQQDTGLPQKQ